MSMRSEVMDAMYKEHYCGYNDEYRPILYWKTKDNRLIAIRDMTTSHLINTIKFLKRQIDGSAHDDWCYDNISSMENELKQRNINYTI